MHVLFTYFFNVSGLKSYVLKSNLWTFKYVQKPLWFEDLPVWHDRMTWCFTRCDIQHGWISRDPLEGEGTSDGFCWTVEVPKTPPVFSCHFPMFGLLFWFQIFAPKQSQVWKTQKEASCFLVMLHYKKKSCTWRVLLVFVCFPWFLIYLPFPLNGEQLRPTSSPIFPRRMRKITSVLPIEMPCGKLKACENVRISKGHWDPFGRDQAR